ncbi:hypothetical protein PG997_012336 [Apiospora hydei]|uniref:Uncharacterized protein n=1 Tax=Apiospora hydei TaxID=1337664 RepID=A0ABR1V328_9PEZI
MFAGLGVAVAATLWTLNRLHDELKELNHHQIVYREMWLDERDQMHRQMEYDEERKDDTIHNMQQQWGIVEKNKRAIMEKGFAQQKTWSKPYCKRLRERGRRKGRRASRCGFQSRAIRAIKSFETLLACMPNTGLPRKGAVIRGSDPNSQPSEQDT